MFGRRTRGLWICMAAAMLIAGSAFTAYADTTIDNIRVTFKINYDKEEGKILEPTVTTGSGYEVEDISWSKALEKWNPGSKITASVTLVPGSGKAFASSYSSQKTTISGADFVSAKRNEDGNLVVKVNYYPVVQLGQTEKAGWSDSTRTKAVWKKVPYATAYQLRLYRGDDEYVTTLTLEGTNVDLTEYITKEANYFYEVRATSKNSTDAGYRRTGDYVTSEDSFVDNLGEVGGRWRQDRTGYRYTDENGVEANNGWRYIQGTWYYFDENGYAATGWRLINGKWYYMNSECKMQTGWLNLNDKWYYTDSTGAMAVGWYQISPSEWYYFYEDGSMAVNTVIDGYTIGGDGKMQ